MPARMFEAIPDLSAVRILVTNDDGVDAPGIKVLERIARSLSKDVWVIAPASEQSAVAHSLTVRRPLRINHLSRRRLSVDGTPTDSVLLGIRQVLDSRRPHLLLSGVNRGGNLGEDVTYSGTVAAAMEGTLLGVPSIALSQVFGASEGQIPWATAAHWGPQIIRRLCAVGWPRQVLINVNFPDLPPEAVRSIEIVAQGKRKLGDELSERIDPRGETYFWIGAQRAEDRGLPGTDLEAVCRGAIAITPLCVDFTHREAMHTLKTAFP